MKVCNIFFVLTVLSRSYCGNMSVGWDCFALFFKKEIKTANVTLKTSFPFIFFILPDVFHTIHNGINFTVNIF